MYELYDLNLFGLFLQYLPNKEVSRLYQNIYIEKYIHNNKWIYKNRDGIVIQKNGSIKFECKYKKDGCTELVDDLNMPPECELKKLRDFWYPGGYIPLVIRRPKTKEEVEQIEKWHNYELI